MMDYQELKAYRNEARRRVAYKKEQLEEQAREVNGDERALDAFDDLFSQLENLKEQVERQEREMSELEDQLEQKDSEIERLQRELLEERNQRLESEKHDLAVAATSSKPLEIHNHFEPGSHSQVFNDKVKGRFGKKPQASKMKKEKKRWKGIVRKML